jgi:1-acyl-sn-glycerol-3-phosphate acyltransferase
LDTAVAERSAVAEEKLPFAQAAGAVGASFAWRPDPLARLLIRAMSRIMRPLEQGSYEGRALDGEPHRASWVIASPLNVFVLPGGGYWRRIVLAARLRHKGEINVVEVGSSAKHASEVLCEMISIQRTSEASMRLIPVARTSHQLTASGSNVSAASKAYKAAPQNLLRKASSLARTMRTGRVKNCGPIVLTSWLDSCGTSDLEEQAAALRLQLAGNIASQHRACSGPPQLPVWEVRRRVLADPVLASYMQEYGLSEGFSREAVLDEARSYIDEIASDYRVGVVRWFARAVDFMFDRFLSGVEVDREGIRYLAECDSRSRLILVCSHKSYLDPLLIGYALFRSGMVPPQQAAGLNLNFWPVGWLLRHSGAFYLRRTFAGETLYTEVFSAYVRYLLAENHIIVVYIEGTRSRDGKLARPKTGFMGILADSLKMGICKDMKLIPVYLGYDKTPEESAHVREMAGGRKVSESVKGFSRIISSINTKLGRAYVKFGEPMSMEGLLAGHGLEETCEIACRGINKVTPVTARSVAASALLSAGGNEVNALEVRDAAEALLSYADTRRCTMAADADTAGVEAAVEWLAGEGHVSRDEVEGAEVYRLDDNGRRFLEYNKNLAINSFLEASLTAISSRGCTGDAVGRTVLENEAFLRGLFDEEFVYGPAAGPGDHLEGSEVLASLLESYVQGYSVALSFASALTGSVSRDEAVAGCMSRGEKMLEDGSVTRPEAVSRPMMANALRKLVACGALAQRRQKVKGGRDKVTLEPGPRFDDLEEMTAHLTYIGVRH